MKAGFMDVRSLYFADSDTKYICESLQRKAS